MNLPLIGSFDPVTQLFIVIFTLSIVFGVFAQKTSFCPLGGIADYLQVKNSGRFATYFFAIAIAMISTTLLETFGLVDIDGTRPPYRMAQFRWAGFALGGFLFGIGMTMSRGCGMRNVLNLGSGNFKAVIAILGMGSAAVLMLYVEGFFEKTFLNWILPLSPDFAAAGFAHSDLGTLAATPLGMDVSLLRTIIGLLLAAIILWVVLRSNDFKRRPANWIGGLVIGLLIAGAFYLSGGSGLGEAAKEASDFMEQPQNGMGTQSYTFIRPMGDMLYVAANPLSYLITFGLVAFIGVGFGSFLISLLTWNFNVQWFRSKTEFFRYLTGGILVGIGGILGMGCTLGQGLAGTSTLALGSFLNLLFILMGAFIGIKMQPRFMDDHQVPGEQYQSKTVD